MGNEAALTKEMNWMLEHFQEYDSERIQQSATRFTYNEVGRQIMSIYQETIKRS